MIWTKLTKLSEDLLSPALQGRVAYHLARYGPGRSYHMRRGWITLDGEEILSCSTIEQVRATHALTGDWHAHEPAIADELHQQGLYTRDEFLEALEMCVSQPIDTQWHATQPLVRALALFDRRAGKRRLRRVMFAPDELALIRNFYRLRCLADGIEPTTTP